MQQRTNKFQYDFFTFFSFSPIKKYGLFLRRFFYPLDAPTFVQRMAKGSSNPFERVRRGFSLRSQRPPSEMLSPSTVKCKLQRARGLSFTVSIKLLGKSTVLEILSFLRQISYFEQLAEWRKKEHWTLELGRKPSQA